jgi:xanthine dehydrogenase YagS FAD-binding subunit
MRNFAYVLPETVESASAEAKVEGAVLKAGGVDLLDLMKGNIIAPQRLVNLSHVRAPGMREIALKDDGIHIGALVTLAQLGASPDLPPVLVDASGKAATPQIRNLATVGGNLAQRVRCWWFRSSTFPCARKEGSQCYAQKGENKYHAVFDNSDCAAVAPSSLASPLVALDAVVVTTKRRIPIEQFFVPTTTDITKEHVLEPGEIITEVFVPKASQAWHNAYREAGERESQDWQLLSASVALDAQGDGKAGSKTGTVKAARIALGGVAVVPYRVKAVEDALAGKPVTAATAARAAELAFAKAKPFEENAYKVPLGKAILKRAILAAAGLPEMGG